MSRSRAAAYISSFGEADGGTISSGGTQNVYSGGIASGSTIGSGGIEILSGGTASGTAVLSDGEIELLSGATISGVSIASSGVIEVGSGFALDRSVAGQFTLSKGAIVKVDAHGTATSLTIASGTQELVSGTGALSISGTVVSGGAETLSGGGTDSAGTMSAGGTLLVSDGGIAIGASVTSGGTLTVIKGGTASGTVVSTGGSELVSSGASIVGATLSGGVVEIKTGGTAGTSLITISSGTLVLDDSQHFSGTVAGLADANQVVDLVDINFAALHPLQYSSSTGSGTLTVTDGVHTAQLALLGNYRVGNFKTATDGHGGTLITDPPVDSSGYLTPHS